ncbi:stage III sporulation protein SpoIIIAB [Bacillus marinisedimentorum]|uniref:stage III sporulation protein SpoIIIAB n=1 Tax=Bacillus marinisedimentorum TaxID=1821260 RepID=UPI0008724EF2|nr:stage III sporulation protein SpoIIIAB [Bacillus marinisedimentorum]
MKLIGAVFILLASTWTGIEASRKLSMRPRQLRQLKSALQTMEAEVIYGHAPLNEIFRTLSVQTPKPLSWLFERFAKRLESGQYNAAEAWIDSLEETRPFTALQKGELEILKQFGESLGRHDREQQQKQIQLALAHLDREEVEARSVQSKYESMMKSLGFLAGLLLIILLM